MAVSSSASSSVSATAAGGAVSFNECDSDGQEEPCYDGDAKHAGVGACVFGKRVCMANGEFLSWGECEGWGSPGVEQCGDELDSDCDGDKNNGCFGCDGVSLLWSDPFKDGSLRLKKLETAAFDAGPQKHSWICSQDAGRINPCGDTVIQLSGGTPTVIGGGGIGPSSNTNPKIKVEGQLTDDIWMLVDCSYGPVAVELDVPNADVTITTKGGGDLLLGGNVRALTVVVKDDVVLQSPLNAYGPVLFWYKDFTIGPGANINIGMGGGLTFQGSGGMAGPSPAPLDPPAGCP